MTGDEALAEQVKRDYSLAPLEPKERALMDYAVKVTRTPQRLSGQDVDRLRKAGWTDEEILTAVEVIGFFNYYARMADALGVEPEAFMREAEGRWAEEAGRDGAGVEAREP